MKTEQEQIEEMSCILTMLINCGGGCMAQYCHLVDNYAKKLIEAGYGDVSEYKAEIERLKAEFKQLETNAEILAWGVRDLNHENYELTKKVKQAKIDVLNKAKERLNSAPNGWAYTTYIDELIEEVENEQKD